MHLKRFEDAEPYQAPNHFGVVGLRLQGFEQGGPENQWVGLSQFLPGGGAGPDSTPFEKVYVVLDGEMTVIIDGEETVLGRYDSCTIAPGEVRKIENRRNDVCTHAGGHSLPAGGQDMTAIANPMSMFDVSSKTALITGASGAFGMVAAQTLASAGCNLVLAAGNQKALDDITTECADMGAEVTPVNARPEDEQACDALVARAVEAYGALDILVVASGMNKVALINDMAPETFTSVMDANVTQSWLLARAAAGQMKAQGDGGKIVLVSSARGLLGHPAGYTAYCASKAAVDGITKALGCELGSSGITVNAIAPTVFRSPLTAWMFEDTEKAKAVRTGFLARVPKGRLGEPEDLAGPLLFLASKASDFYTGHILYADGGYTAG